MKKGILLTLILIIACSAIPLFAGTYYEKGNTFFTINAGIDLPVFVHFPGKTLAGMDASHIKLGGFCSLAYQGCISPRFALGGELGYCFNYIVDGNIFTQVPITARASFIAVQTGKFDLNINGNLGVSFIRYTETRNITPYISLTVNPVYYLTENWGVGLNAGFAACCEFSKDSGNTALFGETPITLSVSYRR